MKGLTVLVPTEPSRVALGPPPPPEGETSQLGRAALIHPSVRVTSPASDS